jgi:hypothetical protein
MFFQVPNVCTFCVLIFCPSVHLTLLWLLCKILLSSNQAIELYLPNKIALYDRIHIGNKVSIDCMHWLNLTSPGLNKLYSSRTGLGSVVFFQTIKKSA